jgi:hypothetical protein
LLWRAKSNIFTKNKKMYMGNSAIRVAFFLAAPGIPDSRRLSDLRSARRFLPFTSRI